MLQGLWAIFSLLRQSITFSKILFFHLLLLNGITWTLILETLRVFSVFKKKIFNFIRPSLNSFFHCHNPKGIKLVTRLGRGLSYLTILTWKNLCFTEFSTKKFIEIQVWLYLTFSYLYTNN